MKFEKQSIINFILNNNLDEIGMNHVSRQMLINSIADIQKRQKKDKVYSVLETENIVFYVGYGSIGFVEGLVLKNLYDTNISLQEFTEFINYSTSTTKDSRIVILHTFNFDLLFKINERGSHILDRLLYLKYPEVHLRTNLLKYFDDNLDFA